jgi:hypothetical protein
MSNFFIEEFFGLIIDDKKMKDIYLKSMGNPKFNISNFEAI